MAVYFVTGKLGCGKTLCTVGKIRDYLEQGRRVATNLDINLHALTKTDSMVSIIRVPDKPSLYDLDALGDGCEGTDESKFGLLVLDELGTWFNSRNWRDKGRLEVIDWFLHARKKHWDIFFIVQNINSLDDQLVSALCEHLVICKRTDRLSIPIIGPVLKAFGLTKVLPKIHVAKVHYGQTPAAMVVDRWWYRGKDLYSAYNTDQIFEDSQFKTVGKVELMLSDSVHSVLPAYYRNNVALIQKLQKQIQVLGSDLKTARRPAGRSLKMTASLIFAALVCMVSVRTYAKYTEYTNKPQQTAPQSQLIPIPKDSAPLLPPPVVAPVVVESAPSDIIEKMTRNAIIKVSSYFVADSQINAVLHLTEGDNVTVITLADARAIGYVATLQGNFATVTKANYSFSFRLPN
jgi:hypothetical protein